MYKTLFREEWQNLAQLNRWFSHPQTWPEWKKRFIRYRLATKLHNDDQNVQVSALIYSMGAQAENVFSSFTFNNEGDKDKYER